MWKERKETERQMEERIRQLGQNGEECISKRTSCGERRGGGEVQERPRKRARKLKFAVRTSWGEELPEEGRIVTSLR